MEFKDIRTNTEGLVKLINFLNSRENVSVAPPVSEHSSTQIFYLISAEGDKGRPSEGFFDGYNISIGTSYYPTKEHLNSLTNLINQIYKK